MKRSVSKIVEIRLTEEEIVGILLKHLMEAEKLDSTECDVQDAMIEIDDDESAEFVVVYCKNEPADS